MEKAVFAVTDEGDEGAGLLIDMTKVTRSTPVDHSPAPLDSETSRRRIDDMAAAGLKIAPPGPGGGRSAVNLFGFSTLN